MFVADDGRGEPEVAHTVEVQAAENAADGSATEAGTLRDMHPGVTLAAQELDLLNGLWGGGPVEAMGTRTAIGQGMSGLGAADPLGRGLGTELELGCSRVQGPTLETNQLGQSLSTMKRESGILVDVHSVSP